MHFLTETIAADLERPREITPQVVRHLDGTYGVDRDAIGPFLEDKLPKLEDDDHDLILSPLFTPKLTDQAAFAELLGSRSIPRSEWPALVKELAGRPTRAHLLTSAGQTYPVQLREVSIERFVHRLRLDGSIPESILQLIGRFPKDDQPILKAVARRAIWERTADHDGRLKILQQVLTVLSSGPAADSYRISDAVELLRIVEDYQPADAAGLRERIPRWEKKLEEEVQAAFDPKPFFSSSVQQMHGGNDHRLRDEARMETKRQDLAFLKRLQMLLE